jgi:hypothetical protein
VIVVALVVCLTHPLIRMLRWFRTCDVWARGVFSSLLRNGPMSYEAWGGEEQFFRVAAKEIEVDLRWHTGLVRRLFPRYYYFAQDMSLVVALVCFWFSGAPRLTLLLPPICWFLSYMQFHLFGWKWLRRACRRYVQRVSVDKKESP